MLDKKKFDMMRKDLVDFEKKREATIQLSRKIIKESKLIIYAEHRGSMDEASKHIKSIKKMMKKLPDKNYQTGLATVARQEFVEALTFFYYISEEKLITKEELDVSTYDYLLGLCDLSGELMRKAVNLVIKDKVEDAGNIRDVVAEIYHEFLKFNLRNNELRKKSDQIKWNLEKLENMMYDLKIKRG